ncbi:MAG: hypothetical protein EBS19_04365 [Spirochaetia bacterium]|nr:hypothetical protein [Spirochaetia bacterium]
MKNEFYYDFNRKEIIVKKLISSYYPSIRENFSDNDLRKINIYPIKDEKVIPDGWKENPIASIEELINEGPLYVHNGVYAWRTYRIYKDEKELDIHKNLQLHYISEIEPLWNKKNLKSLNFFEKIKKIIKTILIISRS